MTTTGFKNIPFTVNIAMHSAIHAEHYVNLTNGGDGRMTFPSGGTQMLFSPLNWATPQPLVVNFNGEGDAELIADITNDYFVNGAGEHRSKRFIIDLSVTALPTDTWTGSIPGLIVGGDHGGNLTIYHRATDTTHSAGFSITLIAGVINAAGAVSHACIVHVTKPDNSTVNLNAANSVGIAMDQVGIWKFEVGAEPACIRETTPGSILIQSSTWTFSTTDGVSGVTTPTTKHQGASYARSGGGTFPPLSNGAYSVVDLTLDENTAASTPALVAGAITTEINSTGGHMVGGGTSMGVAGTRTNAPFTMSVGGDATVEIDGVTIATIPVAVSG